jgi:8-oxo-dGTP pyrophosphatase MutT (NUDIX family)/phosphohistidine phosphatase SixA
MARVPASDALVRAAGCVVWRPGPSEPEVLLVHRPRYDDWSFPKGKLDRGESEVVAAVREVSEETGLTVGLGPPLPDQRYTIDSGQPKVVSYWAARAPGDGDVSSYKSNDEVDKLEWVTLTRGRRRLSHRRDAELLESFAQSGYDSSPLLIVRHAQARSRKAWHGLDSERPLKVDGKRQAQALIPLLRAYAITSVVSSDAARCVDTVLPFVNSGSVRIRLQPALSQDKMQVKGIAREVHAALESSKSIALCSHRPVLPTIFAEVGIEPIALDPAGVVVVHRERGKVVAVEQH